MEKENIAIDPGYLEWAGVAVLKKAYRIFRERGYRVRLAFGGVSESHALERIHRRGYGDFAAGARGKCDLMRATSRFGSRIDEPVRAEIVEALSRKFADFRRANTEGGLSDRGIGYFLRRRGELLRQFIGACHDLDGVVRDIMIPNPDAA